MEDLGKDGFPGDLGVYAMSNERPRQSKDVNLDIKSKLDASILKKLFKQGEKTYRCRTLKARQRNGVVGITSRRVLSKSVVDMLSVGA